jgi:hypothetical protein
LVDQNLKRDALIRPLLDDPCQAGDLSGVLLECIPSLLGIHFVLCQDLIAALKSRLMRHV